MKGISGKKYDQKTAQIFNNGIYNLKGISKALFNPNVHRMLEDISTSVVQHVALHELLGNSAETISDKQTKRYLKKLELGIANFEDTAHGLFTSLYDQTRLDVFDDLNS